MTNMATPPLILLPGLGADARMYREQKKAFPQLVVPDWIAPQGRESLASYSHRLLESVDLPEEYYLGGSSFGGMIAYEMALRRPPLGLFLLSSCRTPRHMKPWLRKVAKLSPLTRLLPWQTAALLAEVGLGLPDGLLPFRLRMLLKHLHVDQVPLVRWGVEAVLRWNPTPGEVTCPVHQLHGERDPFLHPVLPHAELVPRAGHLLTKTHSQVVNRFLAERLS
jgi:pimeloyl-ACP methyl ester carboxylesterase